ncbi:putative tyrosine protein phosphatase 6 [Planoprotostelium fungivorum]|uniref:Putative tyrosine protein phosphatase 6 n=1 Tax=Planoprotostelium fungivorum TaxID=1890364 RepID=A0A2P6N9Z3_9EUKA|nr:putative tyrosine protein phosphatase 6 [Planoprotostelium fungivorum]
MASSISSTPVQLRSSARTKKSFGTPRSLRDRILNRNRDPQLDESDSSTETSICTPRSPGTQVSDSEASSTASSPAPDISSRVHLSYREADRKNLRHRTSVCLTASTRPEDVQENESGELPELFLRPEDRPAAEIFQNIVNFRDVGLNYNKDSGKDVLHEKIFFRSGRLDDATTRDVELLLKKYDIRSVIDLRAETEGSDGHHTPFFPTTVFDGNMAKMAAHGLAPQPKKQHRISTKKEVLTLPNDQGAAKRSTYHINFAGTNYRINSAWRPLSFKNKFKVVSAMVRGVKQEAVQIVGKTIIEPYGLFGLNRDFIDFCGMEICEALKVMSVKDNYPLLVHCTQGKDRTGLVCAFALAVCGASDEHIIMDYHRSQKGLDLQRETMVEEMRKNGLSSEFSDAPWEVMRQTLRYVREEYGTIESYLDKHGFTEKYRQSLRRCLLKNENADVATSNFFSPTQHTTRNT